MAASAKLGKVIDLAWVPLPAPVGGGSVIAVAGEDGSLALVDATQTVEARSLKRRLAAFKNLVGGRWPFPQVSERVCSTVPAVHNFALSEILLAWSMACRAMQCGNEAAARMRSNHSGR